MVVVGLTGGIGSGKSTVAAFLVARGAMLIDADVVAREVVAPDGPAYPAVVERFGPGVVAACGHLDRRALAKVVFADQEARHDLNAIVHPAVRVVVMARLSALAATDPDAVVVLDIPLLAEVGRDRYPVALVIVVETPVEVALDRLVGDRGLSEAEARARMAAQYSPAQRRAIADLVIDNGRDRGHLGREVDRAWAAIQALAVTRHS